MMKRCCLTIVEDKINNKILMVQNMRGVNKGFYNFPGGKIEPFETIEEGSIRENIEETGIIPIDLKTLGKVEFHPINMVVHVFYTDQFKGELISSNSNENRAFWVDRDNIPFDKMRKTDQAWVKDVIEGKHINKRIYFNDDFSLNRIEDVHENIEKYKQRYNKFIQLRKHKYLQIKASNIKR